MKKFQKFPTQGDRGYYPTPPPPHTIQPFINNFLKKCRTGKAYVFSPGTWMLRIEISWISWSPPLLLHPSPQIFPLSNNPLLHTSNTTREGGGDWPPWRLVWGCARCACVSKIDDAVKNLYVHFKNIDLCETVTMGDKEKQRGDAWHTG